MSDTIAKDCLVHYDSRHIQVRRDFLGICTFDRTQFKKKEAPNQECMAMILRLFETLTDHQRQAWYVKAVQAKQAGLSVPPEPKEYPLQLAYGAIVILLYHTFEESTVRCCIAYLLNVGYISRSQVKKNSIPVYYLNIEVVQEALKKQAEQELSGVEFNTSTQVLNSTAKRLNSTPEPPNSDPQGVEFNSNNIDNITEKDKKEKESESHDTSLSTEVAGPSGPSNGTLPSLSDSQDSPEAANLRLSENEHSDPQQPHAETPSSGTRRSRKKKADTDLEHVEPLPPPARPDESLPWNALKALMWADYFRGHTLTESKSERSPWKKAEHAAVKIIQRGISERNFVAVFRFMRGVKVTLEPDPDFRADWWPDNKVAEIWHIEEHFDNMATEIKRKKLERQTLSIVPPPSEAQPQEENKAKPTIFIAGSGPQEPVKLPVYRPKSQVKQGVIR